MIQLRTSEEIERMAQAGALADECMQMLVQRVEPGITTGELDREAEQFIRSRGGIPTFKGYGEGKNRFPATLCTSLNDEVVHGIPSKTRVLHAGDLLKIDLGVTYGGYVGDMARTVAVGEVSEEALRLMKNTRECFFEALAVMVPGNRLGDIGAAVQTHAEAAGYGVVRELTGHGIGREMHEDPEVPNFGFAGRGLRLREGMILAVEPMINAGTHQVIFLKDGWTVKTRDGSLSAHYENTVAITRDGPRILTCSGEVT